MKLLPWPFITAREIVSDFKDLPVDISEEEFVHGEEYERLKGKITEARELIESIYKQHYGLKHTWCGTWMKCDECKSMYSFGGNWSTKEGECPYCRAQKFLEGEK